jgi:hypothetical protein
VPDLTLEPRTATPSWVPRRLAQIHEREPVRGAARDEPRDAARLHVPERARDVAAITLFVLGPGLAEAFGVVPREWAETGIVPVAGHVAVGKRREVFEPLRESPAKERILEHRKERRG